jgi:hypothetical protein
MGLELYYLPNFVNYFLVRNPHFVQCHEARVWPAQENSRAPKCLPRVTKTVMYIVNT